MHGAKHSASNCDWEFPQIENAYVRVNVDVESHPVGHSTSEKLLFVSVSKQNPALHFSILWCSGSHRVRLYIHAHIDVFNLQKLPVECNGGICDVAPKVDRASPNVKTPVDDDATSRRGVNLLEHTLAVHLVSHTWVHNVGSKKNASKRCCHGYAPAELHGNARHPRRTRVALPLHLAVQHGTLVQLRQRRQTVA